MEPIIEVKNVTKDYGNGRGIFNINLEIEKGKMYGFVGANGAGKTTTIRNIMGFLKPDNGKITVCGLDSWEESDKAKKYIGYVPGEISFPDLKSGTEFIKLQAELLGVTDLSYSNSLIKRLQLDITANLKRMSKGMKQKTALVVALIADPEILILDEPTTGLDPLMRVEFMEILKEEAQKGKTIFISSHLYEELEKTCDYVVLIDQGKIVEVADMNKIINREYTDLKIEFNEEKDYEKFKLLGYKIVRDQQKYKQVTVSIKKGNFNELFKTLKQYNVKFISEVKYTLENHFNEVIKKERNDKND